MEYIVILTTFEPNTKCLPADALTEVGDPSPPSTLKDTTCLPACHQCHLLRVTETTRNYAKHYRTSRLTAELKQKSAHLVAAVITNSYVHLANTGRNYAKHYRTSRLTAELKQKSAHLVAAVITNSYVHLADTGRNYAKHYRTSRLTAELKQKSAHLVAAVITNSYVHLADTGVSF
ncbi:hypothetical protein J6590_043709 [Homalodisca vitripennis]|nr:hypothetical protein J6590_043709 [Homalodisca vitripennis]